MKCIYCKNKYPQIVKNGRDRMGNQRYKCQDCNKTFTKITIQRVEEIKRRRLVIHLILAGCDTDEIAKEIEIPEKIIKRWKKLHLKKVKTLLPDKPLLAINTLNIIYRAIEKRRIAKINEDFGISRRKWKELALDF